MNKNIKKINVHKNHRQRLRAELRNIKFNTLDDYKAIEFLLFNCHKIKDTNPIAHNLINRFGNFVNVLEASYDQLMLVEGVGDATASFITSILPLMERYTTQKANSKIKLTTTYDYVKIYGEIIKHSQKEYLAIIPVNNRYEGSKFVKVEVGVNDNVEVIFDHVYNAIRDTDFKKVIIMHNHPSGNPNPSPEDLSTTSLLAVKLHVFKIEILDSIIVSENGYYSFKDEGYMDYIKKNVERININEFTLIGNKTKK